jgi:hypothetical protein
MRSEEKNTKRFWRRGNVLDIAIILLLIAAIATVGYRYYQAAGADQMGDLKNVVMTFRVVEAPESIAQMVQQNDKVYLDSTGAELGMALDVSAQGDSIFEITPIQVTTKDDKGDTVTVTLPVVNLSGGLLCQGTMGEDGTFLLDGRTPITPGQRLTVHTETATFTLTVMAVSTWQK